MENPKSGLVAVLKRKLDNKRTQVYHLAIKYEKLKKENRYLKAKLKEGIK